MWTKLCEKNVQTFNDHPAVHAAIFAAYTGVASYAFGRFVRKLAADESVKK
jgi:hypothetical protein